MSIICSLRFRFRNADAVLAAKNRKFIPLIGLCFLLAKLSAQSDEVFAIYGIPSQYFEASDIQAHNEEGAWILASISGSDEYQHDLLLYHVNATGQVIDSTRFPTAGWQEEGQLSAFSK